MDGGLNSNSLRIMKKSENYLVLARKYRPKKLEDILGQEETVSIIKGSIELKRLGHAFLFSGTRGTGKTSLARILAKIVNCESEKNSFEPCQECGSCKSIESETNVDVVEIDAASRTGVSDVREIIENINYKPLSSKKKIYIIDEVHMLSKAAFNALLKTLEEPPSEVIFIFATTETNKIPVTILSRCQKFQLKRLSTSIISEHLVDVSKKEGFSLDSKSADIIAESSEGSLRDSLSILDNVLVRGNQVNSETVRQVLGLADKKLLIDLFELIFLGDSESALKKFDEIYVKGVSIDNLAKELMGLSYRLARIKSVEGNNEDDDELNSKIKKMSKQYEMDFIVRFWELLRKFSNEISSVFDEKQCFEMIILRLCYFSSIPSPFEGLTQIVKKESKEETDRTKSVNSGIENIDITSKSSQENLMFIVNSKNEIEKFSKVVELIDNSGEILLSYHLRKSFRLVKIIVPREKKVGVIELECVSNVDHKSILWKTSKLLQNLTSKRWMTSISNSSSYTSLLDIEKKKENSQIQELKNDKLLKKFLEIIPLSEVISIERIKFKNLKKESLNE